MSRLLCGTSNDGKPHFVAPNGGKPLCRGDLESRSLSAQADRRGRKPTRYDSGSACKRNIRRGRRARGHRQRVSYISADRGSASRRFRARESDRTEPAGNGKTFTEQSRRSPCRSHDPASLGAQVRKTARRRGRHVATCCSQPQGDPDLSGTHRRARVVDRQHQGAPGFGRASSTRHHLPLDHLRHGHDHLQPCRRTRKPALTGSLHDRSQARRVRLHNPGGNHALAVSSRVECEKVVPGKSARPVCSGGRRAFQTRHLRDSPAGRAESVHRHPRARAGGERRGSGRAEPC